MVSKLLITTIIFSLLSLSTSLPAETILGAAEILSNSGFISMALTLELVSATLIPQSAYVTIFSPSDLAFARSGQPPLSLLQFHFSPLSFSLRTLKSLTTGSKIPTLLPNRSLIVTSSPSDNQVSLNGVKVTGSALYDDGSLIIFGIEDFFDPDFQFAGQNHSNGVNTASCVAENKGFSGGFSFSEASGVMRSRGYSVMASFLDLQFVGFKNKPALTVFAPVDDVVLNYASNFSDFASILFRHVVPCKISWVDLVNFEDETELPTYLDGFKIDVTRSGDVMMLNGVQVMFPDMYFSDWIVVHGIHEVLLVPGRSQEETVTKTGSKKLEIVLEDGEF